MELEDSSTRPQGETYPDGTPDEILHRRGTCCTVGRILGSRDPVRVFNRVWERMQLPDGNPIKIRPENPFALAGIIFAGAVIQTKEAINKVRENIQSHSAPINQPAAV